MIDRLAAVPAVDADTAQLSLTRFDLGDVVDEARALLAGAIEAREIRYTAELGPEPLVVRGDRDRILQVFLNLVGNAVKFNVRGGRIDVRATRESSDRARVEVEDTGIGIAPEAIGRIFDRHYRAADDESGRGLGLAIVRDVLHRHGSRIDVTSEPSRGTRFTFTLPIESDRPGGSAPRGGGDRPGLGAPFRARFRILR